MSGWAAAEVIGLKPQIIPEELKAEHNAVLGSGPVETASVSHRCCPGDIDVPSMLFPGGRRSRSGPAGRG
jgi:hypothetical protein